MKTTIRRAIASVLMLSIIALGVPARAVADPAPRQQAKVQLVAQGVDEAEAQARVAALTDEEAARLAARIDGLPAGGNPAMLGAPLMVAVGAAMVIALLPFIVLGAIVVAAATHGTSGSHGPLAADPDPRGLGY